MPRIRFTCPENSFTAEQEAELAPLLVEAVMVEESTRSARRAVAAGAAVTQRGNASNAAPWCTRHRCRLSVVCWPAPPRYGSRADHARDGSSGPRDTNTVVREHFRERAQAINNEMNECENALKAYKYALQFAGSASPGEVRRTGRAGLARQCSAPRGSIPASAWCSANQDDGDGQLGTKAHVSSWPALACSP